MDFICNTSMDPRSIILYVFVENMTQLTNTQRRGQRTHAAIQVIIIKFTPALRIPSCMSVHVANN